MFEFRPAAIDEIILLRHEILRKGRPIKTAYFQEDNFSDTYHFALFDESGKAVSCLTLIPTFYNEKEAWKLRGMATQENLQGKGLGKQLIEQSIAFAQKIKKKELIWCNARETAVRFYEKAGWKIDSEKFMIEPIGWHYKMQKELENTNV